MKKKLVILIVLFACIMPEFVIGQTKTPSATRNAAQSKSGNSAPKNNKNVKNTKGKKKPVKKEPTPEIELPYNSNDCLFAVELKPDIPFGPTTAPSGGGRIMEIQRDSKNSYLFEIEHNTVWYKFVAPYSGLLYLEITPTDPSDDYDFLVYRYTNQYFTNELIFNRIKPVIANLSLPDSASKGCIGISSKGKKAFIGKNSTEPYNVPISVSKGEVIYIVLDKPNNGGKGHTIKASVHVESFEPKVSFYDPKLKKNIDVEILLIEKNTDNRILLKNAAYKGGKIRFVPNFNYALYAKKDGYFSIYKDFNSNIFKEDTVMKFIMNRTEKGTKFPLTEVYFEDGDIQLMKESDTVLNNYVQMFKNHPNVEFNIKGYVNSYGFDLESDIQRSYERASAVKDFFVKNGIEENRMTVSGMTKGEINKVANEVLNKNKTFNAVKIEFTITNVKK